MNIQFINTLEEELLRCDLDYLNRTKRNKLNIIFCVGLCIISDLLVHLSYKTNILELIIEAIIIIVFIILYKVNILLRISKIIVKKHKKYLQVKHIALSEHTLLITIGSKKISEPINKINKYIIYNDKIYIKFSYTDSLIIPKRAFDNNMFDEFIALIQKNTVTNSKINTMQQTAIDKSFAILLYENYKTFRILRIIAVTSLTFVIFMLSMLSAIAFNIPSEVLVPMLMFNILVSLYVAPKIYDRLGPILHEAKKLQSYYKFQKNLVIKTDGLTGKNILIPWNDIQVYRIINNSIFFITKDDSIIPVYIMNNEEQKKIIRLLNINEVKKGNKKDFNLKRLLKAN